MEFVKEAVKYYCSVTGRDWQSFYSLMDSAMAGSLDEQDGEEWLVHAILLGRDLDMIRSRRDEVKILFDEEVVRDAGEFYTPVFWAEEARRYIDRLIPDWRGSYTVWEPSCGTGNLIRDAGIRDLYASTLQAEDVELVRGMMPDAHVFQLDFLSAVDDGMNNMFTSGLPSGLRDVIENDRPLVIFANPPYRVGMANQTEVGSYMQHTKSLPEYEFHDFSDAAYDLLHQCCFQVMNLVARFNLSNTYYCFFSPTTLFTASKASAVFRKFEKCFEFLDGMCIDAKEFSCTSTTVDWSIGFSCWKSRGGYDSSAENNGVVLNRCMRSGDRVVSDRKIAYRAPRMKLSDWVKPKETGLGAVEFPLMTSHLTFKGSKVFEKVAPRSGMMQPDALGTLMTGNTLTRNSSHSALMSMPNTMTYVDVVEENFWRCVASFAFRRSYNAGWDTAKKECSAPDTTVPGYQVWLHNALVSFLFEQKSMMSSMRGVSWGGYTDFAFHNRLFYLSESEVRESCTDEVILRDLAEHPMENGFMLERIREAEPDWWPEARALFDWCVGYTKRSYGMRAGVGYRGSTDCADAGFQQIRSAFSGEDFSVYLDSLVPALRVRLKTESVKYGFLSVS